MESTSIEQGAYTTEAKKESRATLATEIERLGDRFKTLEQNYVRYLDPTKYTVLRVDGHCFSTFTKQFAKPYDYNLSDAMIYACGEWMKEFNGTCVYTQSDEATMIIAPPDSKSELMFSGRVEKITTLSAALFSVCFGEILRAALINVHKPATFDCRVFQVGTISAVCDVIKWRQLDCFRNGITGIARSLYSAKELHGVSVGNMIKMLDTETLEAFKNSHLVHGTFVKKAIVNKEMPDGTKVTRTVVKSRCIGDSIYVATFKKEDILSKYLSVKVEKLNQVTPTRPDASVSSVGNVDLDACGIPTKILDIPVTPKEAPEVCVNGVNVHENDIDVYKVPVKKQSYYDSVASGLRLANLECEEITEKKTKEETEENTADMTYEQFLSELKYVSTTQPGNAAQPVPKQSSQPDRRLQEWFLDQ